jgi:hypothetical protein
MDITWQISVVLSDAMRLVDSIDKGKLQTLKPTAIPMYAKLTQILWKDALLQKSYNHCYQPHLGQYKAKTS